MFLGLIHLGVQPITESDWTTPVTEAALRATDVWPYIRDEVLEEKDWNLVVDVNLKGQFLCCKYAIPHMQAIGKGAIVNISSVHSFATVNGVAPYAASKGGITALTRNLAIDSALPSESIRLPPVGC
jgi:NAD(P)-dependent dehydrogenase (short-subunit alcohol dehydrogenase family)